MTDLASLIRAPQAGGPPRQLVVLIHGYGAGGADLIDLAPLLALSLPHALFVAPDAPLPCEMAAFGRQWFSLRSRTREAMAAGVAEAGPVLTTFILAELDRYRLGASALGLVGFSQGAMVALHVALRMAPPPAAVVALSGRLVETMAPDERLSAPPVLMIHGDADDVVPVQSMSLAERALRASGVPVDSCLRPGLGHGIDPEGIDRTAGFLLRHFGA